MIQIVAVCRVVLAVLMAFAIDTLPCSRSVFVALVLQKTYLVSKSALVPSVVRTERELVEANSKLGLIAGVIGFVAVVPAGILQLLGNAKGTATLIYSGDAVRLRPVRRLLAAGGRGRHQRRPMPRRSESCTRLGLHAGLRSR